MQIRGWHRWLGALLMGCVLAQALWGLWQRCAWPAEPPMHAARVSLAEEPPCHPTPSASPEAHPCADCVACLHWPAGPPAELAWQEPGTRARAMSTPPWPLPPSPDLPGLERPPRIVV